MAAPTSRMIATCRLIERLVLSGSASTSSPNKLRLWSPEAWRQFLAFRFGSPILFARYFDWKSMTRRFVCSKLLTRVECTCTSHTFFLSCKRLHTAQKHVGQVNMARRCAGGVGVPSLSSQCPTVCKPVASPLSVPCRHTTWYTDKRISGNLGAVGVGKVDPDFTPITDQTEGLELAQRVNANLEQEHGRLFAVVYINGVQRKVTVEDILVIENEFPPTVGDRIRLEKVLLVGGTDFTLLGQPILSREQVRVEATVIEKTLSHNKVDSTYKRRKRFRKMKLFRTPHTMMVINSIELGSVPEA